MTLSLPKLLGFGIALELFIFIASYLLYPEIEETFRYAARYSGRLSAAVFLLAFYAYTMAFPKSLNENMEVRNLIIVFAVLHLIHFGFLASNIFLNEIPLIPVKLLGGALAYLMIVWAPFKLHQLKLPLQLTYFYYVTFVMIMTYFARVKGDFEGAEPQWLHFVALTIFISCSFVFGLRMWNTRKARKINQ